ncbi:flagellar filament capping protein FliD [Geodermatophilus sp. DSM 44513]|uniref:flagellar filament capping protein FliD n=1 Tax=Geodermatophilus sp. DSM 44513 TaxID=1528104 RepID=UPI00127D7E68|nr:flagellar filament capping protein FliD [Geodermatophilus sp. DSM 44513]WNV76473.1 flagellar filament capping protein FliD [Geodermatophilus sp. DSM 44513]
MAGFNISGLASGLDTTSIISQLMQLERQPQTLLRTKLTDTKADASAYRTVNSTVSTLQSAAEKLTQAATWTPVKASSSHTSVSASASAGAATGQISFSVTTLAASHTVIDNSTWSDPTSDVTLTVTDADGDTAAKDITITAGSTLDQAVTTINAAKAGVTATAVNTGAGFRLQLTSTASGLDGKFTTSGGITFGAVTDGTDAQLSVAGGAYTATSATNTFSDLMPGTTFTVSEKGATATVTVASDPAALASAVQAMVDAANTVLTTINERANNSPGSTAVLRGDSSLRALAGQLVDAVTHAVGADGTLLTADAASKAGITVERDGKLKFDSAKFTALLTEDPALARRLVDGDTSGTTAVPGVAQRLLTLAKSATDATTGSLVTLANGKDSEVSDIQKRIDAWDQRLELRQQTLTRQFTALESALSSLQSQSSWLSGQLASLPGWSSSS